MEFYGLQDFNVNQHGVIMGALNNVSVLYFKSFPNSASIIVMKSAEFEFHPTNQKSIKHNLKN